VEDGSMKKLSSMTLAADQLWEFDDVTFRNVMKRQRKEQEIEELKRQLAYNK
jgi:hypothetical protein